MQRSAQCSYPKLRLPTPALYSIAEVSRDRNGELRYAASLLRYGIYFVTRHTLRFFRLKYMAAREKFFKVQLQQQSRFVKTLILLYATE